MGKRILYSLILLMGGKCLISQSTGPCNSIPKLNEAIVTYVKQHLNKKVDRGECWDLAAAALNANKATWDGKYEFGKIVTEGECVFPGDIVQFKDVELHYKKGKAIYKEKLTHHTAIIYEVKEQGNYTIADQNTQFSGRKVGIHQLDVSTLKKGTIRIYRPQN